MMPRPYGPAETLQGLLDAARIWSHGALGAQEVLARAARRSGEEARDARESAKGTPNGAFLARAGDLARAQWFLWAWATLAAGERLGRASSGSGGVSFGLPPIPPAPSPRTMVLGTIASDLYLGYAALRERALWFPGMVRPEDRELAHRRGAGRLLDAAQALGGTLIKAGQFASTRPDLLPLPYVATLSSLQDRLPPQPQAIIEEAVARELDGPVESVFSEFGAEPIAAASIAQVHRARLANCSEVAGKIQYPCVAALMQADLDARESIFAARCSREPDIQHGPISDCPRGTPPLEHDFRREAGAVEEL